MVEFKSLLKGHGIPIVLEESKSESSASVSLSTSSAPAVINDKGNTFSEPFDGKNEWQPENDENTSLLTIGHFVEMAFNRNAMTVNQDTDYVTARLSLAESEKRKLNGKPDIRAANGITCTVWKGSYT